MLIVIYLNFEIIFSKELNTATIFYINFCTVTNLDPSILCIIFMSCNMNNWNACSEMFYVDVKSNRGISRGVKGGKGASRNECALSNLVSSLGLTDAARSCSVN